MSREYDAKVIELKQQSNKKTLPASASSSDIKMRIVRTGPATCSVQYIVQSYTNGSRSWTSMDLSGNKIAVFMFKASNPTEIGSYFDRCMTFSVKHINLSGGGLSSGRPFLEYSCSATQIEEAFFRFVHDLTVERYSAIYGAQKENYYLAAVMGLGKAIYCNVNSGDPTTVEQLHSWTNYTCSYADGKTQIFSYSSYKNFDNTNDYKNHFFVGSGYVSGASLVRNQPSKFFIYRKSSNQAESGLETSSSITNTYSGLGSNKNKYAVAQIKDGKTNSNNNYTPHYIDVTKEIEDGTINEDSDSGSNYDSPGGNTGADTTYSYDAIEMDKYSTAAINYITNLNNWNLFFVPAQDERKNQTTETPMQVQTIDNTGQKKTSSGQIYYKTDNNTLLGILKVSNDNPDVDPSVAEPVSKRSVSSDLNQQDLAEFLDEYFHYNSLSTNSFIGRYIQYNSKNELEEQDITIIDGYNEKYYIRRMPKICALIVKKSVPTKENFSSITEFINWYNSQKNNILSFSKYFDKDINDRKEYTFLYYTIEIKKVEPKKGTYISEFTLLENTSFANFISTLNPTLQIAVNKSYDIVTSVRQERGEINLYDFKLIKAYTRGHDFIQESYTQVRPQESIPTSKSIIPEKKMSFEDNYFTYKYTGREIDITNHETNTFTLDNNILCGLIHEKDLLLETDVTLGDTYGEQKYFIEAIKYPKYDENEQKVGDLYLDTFKVKNFLKAIDSTKYTDDDIEIVTSTIDLLRCQYYDPTQATYENNWCDCGFSSKGEVFDKECIYQKIGKCPYRFQAEKHPRRIRTLEQSKSNRFNLIQEVSKVFEVYPQFYIEYDKNGRILLNENERMKKHVFFMTEKGQDKYTGFRYEKNLSGITRTVDSNALTTKMYVENIDSELTESGICSIQMAEDNIGKNAYVLNFSYYTKKNLLNPEQTQRDVFGIDKGDLAFLPTIGAYNKKYDEYTNLIINMTGQEMTELQASNDVALTGISTALEERKKIAQRMYQFKVTAQERKTPSTEEYTKSDTYQSYLYKYREQATILWGLVEQLFFSGDYFTYRTIDTKNIVTNKIYTMKEFFAEHSELKSHTDLLDKYCKGELFWRIMFEGFEDLDEGIKWKNTDSNTNNWITFKEEIVDKNQYILNGNIGQYTGLYYQVKHWKKEREKILNKINDISERFYKKYEPYIKEGTWTDSNYLTNNEYYWAAESVLEDSCKPKLNYTINVIDISPLKEYEDDYKFELADTTYIEDIDFFDINPKTGLPNREKVIISEITYSLDQPSENNIVVQNYTTSFDDLFGQITASVQSLTYNENTYKRASNFTAKQYIQSDSLQGTLDEGDLTLIDSNNSNIVLDDSGAQGNDITNNASQYKLSGEGLFFSTDGGETWDLGVSPKGFNMDYAKFGQLDASKVQIIDGEYIYFLWDKNGINAYRNPATSTNGLVDFARFNRYGLSLIEKGKVRLRAGYEYKDTKEGENQSGDYLKELSLVDQDIGFYLYNDNGKPIFKTETQSSYNDDTTDYSARLSLKGEMFVTNSNLAGDNKGNILASSIGERLQVGYEFSNKAICTIFPDMYASTIFNVSDSNWRFTDNGISGDALAGKTGKQPVTPTYNAETQKSEIQVIIIRRLSKKQVSKPNFTLYVDQDGAIKTITSSLYEMEYEVLSCFLSCNKKITEKVNVDCTELANNFEKSSITLTAVSGSSETWHLWGYKTESDPNHYYTSISSQVRAIYETTVRVLEKKEDSASVLIAANSLEPQTVEYYNKMAAGEKLQSKKLYNISEKYGTEVYEFWENKVATNEYITTQSSALSTSEVGIFINNKLGVNEDADRDESVLVVDNTENDEEAFTNKIMTVASGAERLFTIALSGEKDNGDKIYKNVLSVLKNGNLYIGGDLKDKNKKTLSISNFSYLPDKISISQPSIIMSNDGTIWCNWHKFFNISESGDLGSVSLYEVLSHIQEGMLGGSSPGGSSTSGPSGWYIIDPIE